MEDGEQRGLLSGRASSEGAVEALQAVEAKMRANAERSAAAEGRLEELQRAVHLQQEAAAAATIGHAAAAEAARGVEEELTGRLVRLEATICHVEEEAAAARGAEEELTGRVTRLEATIGHVEASLKEELRAGGDAADADLGVFKVVTEQRLDRLAEAQVRVTLLHDPPRPHATRGGGTVAGVARRRAPRYRRTVPPRRASERQASRRLT